MTLLVVWCTYAGMDLTSLPLSPYKLKPQQIVQQRIALAQAADLMRMQAKYIKAEKLYLEAAKYAEGGAAKHLERSAAHCRQIFEANKRSR